MNISIYKVILNSILVLGILFYVLLVNRPGSLSALWFLLILMLFFYLNVYIHEFGHAITGSLLGFQIKRLIIGTGRELIRFRIGRGVVIINGGVSGGVTHWGKVPGKQLKRRFAILILGGVIAQAVAVLICWFFLKVPTRELLTLKKFA